MSRALLRLIWALGIMFMAGWVGVALAILALDPVKTETIPFWGFTRS